MGRGPKGAARKGKGSKKRRSTQSLSKLLDLREGRRAQAKLARAAAATRGRLRACWVNGNWQEQGMASMRLVRERTAGTEAVAMFLVDLHGIGVKDATARLSVPRGGAVHEALDTPMEPEVALAIVHAGLS